ncbi:MAG TPA: hypothetical protein VF155_02990, partial [Candidatus Dormibacteraeota bacterium]
ALVVDGSHPECEAQLRTVLETLADMGCDQAALLVVNKMDRLTAAEQRRVRLALGDIAGTSALSISARTGAGLRDLRQSIDSLAGRIVADTRANRPITAALVEHTEPRHAAG